MDAIDKNISDAEDLEQRLAEDIASLAAELEPFPPERDEEALNAAWTRAAFSRGKLAKLIRLGLREINAGNVPGSPRLNQVRAARNRLHAMKIRLGLWAHLSPVVNAQLRPERRDLVEDDFRTDLELKVLDQVMTLFFTSMHRLANPNKGGQSEAAKKHGCHRDIPLPMNRFSQMIGAAHRVCLALQRPRPLRFLDVGCGGGTKVLAATTCFEICDGLEYDELIVAEGRRFLGMLQPERCSLIHGDALQFPDYGSYDVIYFYRPLIKTSDYIEMEKRIISQAKRGTVLLNAAGTCLDDLPARGVHELQSQVYITGMTSEEAAELAENATYMGPMVPAFRSSPFTRQDYWGSLLKVSARNGYFI